MRGKGIVVEIAERNQVVIMTSRGEFIKVPFRKHVCVGQEVHFTRKERLSLWQLGFAAALFLVLIGSWPILTTRLIPVVQAPAFIITLDINPSLELQVSEDHTVIEADGLNQDGKNLLTKVAVVGQDLRSAISLIGEQARKDGYLKQGQNEVIVTIAVQGDSSSTLTELKNSRTGTHSKLEQAIVEAFTTTQLAQVRIWQVPARIQEEAKLAGITPSRYIAIHVQPPIVPQRMEARLTMNTKETVDTETAVSRRTSGNLVTTTGLGSVRPTLAPVQWTNRTTAQAASQGAYGAALSGSSRVKGDLDLNE
ncbi:MAG: anti-sigma factor domain-containing protein [Firmicutes bacterium]|nr:anti-sigma factor domain-containing protein [Bacillota bacterium]